MSLLIDKRAVTQYNAKYCKKIETPNKSLEVVIRDSLRIERESLQNNPRTVLRRAFDHLVGRIDKSIMEICHLITSSSYVECTHAFVMVNLISQTR